MAFLPTSELTRTRVTITFFGVAPAVAETLLSVTKTIGGVASAASTNVSVTAGKTLRITNVLFSLKAGAAAAAFATLNLRQNPTGATVLTTPAELRVDLGNTAAAINASLNTSVVIPDGLEYKGSQTLGLTLSAQAVTNVISITLSGYEF